MTSHDSASSVPDARAAPDRAEIARAVDILIESGGCTELRILHNGRRPDSGYYVDRQACIDAACTIVQGNAYITPNPVNPALAARAYNRLQQYAKHTTTDHDITRRRWLLIDIEHQRPTDIAATEAEHAAALERAECVVAWLTAHGIPPRSIVLADSGNGAHILIRVDLPNDDAATQLVRHILAAVALEHGDESVKIDQSVCNAARIVRLYGTINRKGDSIPERPHRQSQILSAPPSGAEPVERDVLERMAALAPSEALQPARQSVGGGMQAFIDTYHPEVLSGPIPWGAGHRKWHVVCPFNPEHTGSSAALLELASGALAFKCQHDSCQGKDWQDIKTHFGVESLNGYAHLSARPASATTTAPSGASSIEARPFMTAAELLAGRHETVDWLVPNLLMAGGISVLGARPKVGKTVVSENLAVSLARGEPFLTMDVVQGAVLALWLQSHKGETAVHTHGIGLQEDDPLYSYIGAAPQHPIDWLRDGVERYTPKLVIVDTVQALLRFGDTSDYAKVTNGLEWLGQLARDTGTCVLFLHHERKSSGDGVDGLLGSIGFSGSVDTVLSMRKSEAYRTLRCTEYRYGHGFEEQVVEMDPNTYRLSLKGSRHEADVSSIAAEIHEYLAARPDERFTEPELLHEVEGRNALKREALRSLVAGGTVHRSGPGIKGQPFTYQNARTVVPTTTRVQGYENPKTAKFSQQDAKNTRTGPLADTPALRNARVQERPAAEPTCQEPECDGRGQPAEPVGDMWLCMHGEHLVSAKPEHVV